MINLVIGYSQQHKNKCKAGDEETDHMYTIAKALYDILSQDKRLNIYLVPQQDTGDDRQNLWNSIKLGNDFLIKNGGEVFALEFHSDAGGYAKGASGLFKDEAGRAFLEPILKELMDLTPTTDVGMRKRDDLGFLNQKIGIRGLIEISFHDNPIEAAWIHANPIPIAVRLANGIYKSLVAELSTVAPAKPTYTHTFSNGVHIVEIDPLALSHVWLKTPQTAAQLAKVYKNFTNMMFHSGGIPIRQLIVDEKIVNPYPDPSKDPRRRGTLIIYTDGKPEIRTCRELDAKGIKLAVQGFNLDYEANGSKSLVESMRLEGWGEANDYIHNYRGWRGGIGIRDGKILLVEMVGNSADLRAKMREMGCKDAKGNTLAIGKDSGKQDALALDGKVILGTSEGLTSIITF
jgi:hypothetical protein